jgi:glycosyltransferase involved in cell wall biosynthesis
LNISVIIPTIGDRDLIPTLNSLQNTNVAIDEIIISVPEKTEINKNLLLYNGKITIHFSKYKGQVLQRIEGFKVAKNDIVVQLDDDIVLEKNCLKLMYHFIKLNKTAALSAHFHDIISKKSIYTKEGNSRFSSFFFLSELNYFKNKFVSKIYNKIKNGNTIEQKGAISKSGFETYPDIQIYSEPFITGWIPGGCVMHYKSNLVLYNFFPFSGKAYCEDLYHSIALKKNNIKLYYHPNAKAYLKIESVKSNFTGFVKYLKNDFVIRKQLVEENKLSKTRMIMVYIIKTFSYLFK